MEGTTAPEGTERSMSQTTTTPRASLAGLERVLLTGDLAELSQEQRVSYYARVCESVGLNPLTQPFEYLTLNNRMILYACRACTDQLRQIHGVSITIVSRDTLEGCYVVTARATLPTGRCDESVGAVPIQNLRGESLANAVMKAETKAKRRVTLALCGLSTLDESELEGVPGARPVPPESFPLASLPAPVAPQQPQEAEYEPPQDARQSAQVLPFRADQAPAEAAIAPDALAMFGPKLRSCRDREELVGWMRQVIAHGFEPAAKRALFDMWSRQVRACLRGQDPNVLLAEAKRGAK